MRNILPFILVIAILLLACIVAFASRDGAVDAAEVLRVFAWNLPVCLLVGFIDYGIITLSHRWRPSFCVWTILADLMVSNVLLCLLSVAYIYVETQFNDTGMPFPQRLAISVFCNSIIVLIVEIFFYNQRYLENKAHLATMEKEKAQYQFEALKNQINPHFLFNSLNVLSSLAYQDAAKANLFAKRLSSVYRYLLTTQELMKVPLQDELDFVKSYVYLEQVRFGETLHVNIILSVDCTGKHIVPASIQMLVENALKHNINTNQSPLTITVTIGNESVTVSNNLQLRTQVNKNRFGLDNIEKQYSINGKHIKVEKSETQFTVTLPLL